MPGEMSKPALAPDATTGPARYGVVDRLLHRAAFSALELQKSVADIESRLYGRRIRDVAVDRPVFVAALPRAGTTMLLNALFAVGAFAAHTYRDMPFLLTPLLWSAFSRRFQRPSTPVARAHGDGMTVEFDSPEAFEEVLWRAFWRQKYENDEIGCWTAADARRNGEFRAFFRAHVAKVVALGRGVALRHDQPDDLPGAPRRYLSKNNANIARFPAIREMFPDAVFLVPFRNPRDQAGSLLRQHQRFCRVHAAHPFARRYMSDLGHFEFGANLRPIRFPSDAPQSRDARRRAATAQYWLEYWCAAYAHVLESAPPDALLISYDRLCAEPDAELERIAARTDLDEPATRILAAAGRGFRPPARRPDACDEVEPQLLATAAELHGRLLERAAAQEPATSQERATS